MAFDGAVCDSDEASFLRISVPAGLNQAGDVNSEEEMAWTVHSLHLAWTFHNMIDKLIPMRLLALMVARSWLRHYAFGRDCMATGDFADDHTLCTHCTSAWTFEYCQLYKS